MRSRRYGIDVDEEEWYSEDPPPDPAHVEKWLGKVEEGKARLSAGDCSGAIASFRGAVELAESLDPDLDNLVDRSPVRRDVVRYGPGHSLAPRSALSTGRAVRS